MRVLVLGGTAWLGGHVASVASERGDHVTCLARGVSGAVPGGVTLLCADRDEPHAYDGVARGTWDVVVDVSRQPGHVRRAVVALAPRSETYVFVSSGNVYADHRTPGHDESAPLLPALAGDVMETMATYGEAKVACEEHVLAAYGTERSLLARVGLIGGPGDPFDRTGYWPLRFARPAAPDGAVLVPRAPNLATQLIDVRDLAGWLVAAAVAGVRGTFNVAGETLPLADHLAVARSVAGHTGPVVAAEPEWLLSHGVQPWMGERSLPLWLADADWAGFNAADSSKARAAGLTTRPLAETLADTLGWELSREPGRRRRAGLSDEDERELLARLAA
ncbi:MAG: oxidoreductase [Actinomycetota bacterium]|nr:oxidoreductase [Actinomycetota bacterium]